MRSQNPLHQKNGWASGVEVKILDMCWCKKEPKNGKHERGCARERNRRSIK